MYVLFVAVEVVDWRFELNGLDHFPRAQRIQVGAAVRRVGSERESTGSISRYAFLTRTYRSASGRIKQTSQKRKRLKNEKHIETGGAPTISMLFPPPPNIFFSSSPENRSRIYFHYAPFVYPF